MRQILLCVPSLRDKGQIVFISTSGMLCYVTLPLMILMVKFGTQNLPFTAKEVFLWLNLNILCKKLA